MRQIATIATLVILLLSSASVYAQELQWGGTFDNDRNTMMIYEGRSPQTFAVCVKLVLGADNVVVSGDRDTSEITLTEGTCVAIESTSISVRPAGIDDEFRRSDIDAAMFGTFQRLE